MIHLFLISCLISTSYSVEGVCPEPGVGICVESCGDAYGCPEGELCCYNGCGHVCMEPVYDTTTEEPQVTAPETTGPIACLTDVQECPDGSVASRVPPKCDFECPPCEPVVCITTPCHCITCDEYECVEPKCKSDQVLVVPEGRCCAICENAPIACTADAMLCPDGVTFVGRVPPDCDFEECPSAGICSLPQVVGECDGYFPRYYYDPIEQKCKQLVYGGCDGNDNNFETFAECNAECPAFCGGKGGIPCDDGFECQDDRNDDCNPKRGDIDCSGICVAKKGKKAKTGDSCDLCIRPLCVCGLCPDGINNFGCCGECQYQESVDGLQCLYKETATGCPGEAKAEVINPEIGIESIGEYIGMGYKQIVWFNLIVCVLVIAGCITCYYSFKKCNKKYRYVDGGDDSEIMKLNV